jgi:Zn-finger nucleic acid-binding protein
MMALVCPKCQGQMRQYERGGVVVDQCGECRGVFLDRGELESLIDAEAQWSARGPQRPARQQYDDRAYDERRYDDRSYEQRAYHDKHHHKKKRKSFFEELFDD